MLQIVTAAVEYGDALATSLSELSELTKVLLATTAAPVAAAS